MPITIIPDTGVNNIYINADTGRNVILSGISPTGENIVLSGFTNTAPHNLLKNLQGGQAGQYYHLTADEYNNLATGQVIDTGLFYPTSNPSGYITGVDLTAYVTGDVVRPSDTGNFYPTSNPSGFLSSEESDFRYVNITGNEIISGNKTVVDTFSVSGVYFGSFPTSPIHQEGLVFYSDERKTLSFFNDRTGVEMNIGEELWGRAVNKTLSTLNNGTVVYISGAQGQRPTIWPAIASNAHADIVIGVVTEDIINNDEGYVTVFGSVRGLNLSSYLEGQVLYLSETISGGFQANKPIAPNHAVRVGYVVNNHHINGTLLVNIHNGGEFNDLHDVLITGPQNRDSLFYNSGIWINRPINTGDVSGISNFYLNSNPSGFITGVDLSDYVTGEVIRPSDTGRFYPSSNPSGFITGTDQISFSVLLPTGIEETGVLYPRSFSSIPRVFANLMLNTDTGYYVGIKNTSITGYVAVFSDVIEETGLYLQTFATNL